MKIAVITGASSGMGREFVRQIPHFYMNLDELWIISRRKDRLEAIAKTCSVPVRIFAGDLTDPMFLQTVKDTLQRLRPDIRMLVNAAGFGKSGTVLDIAKEEWPAQSNGASQLRGIDKHDAFVCALSVTRKSDPADCICCGICSAARVCGLCSHQILCTQLFQSSWRRVEEKRNLCHCSLPGTCGHRIF